MGIKVLHKNTNYLQCLVNHHHNYLLFYVFLQAMKRQEGFPGQMSYVIPEPIQEMILENPLISDLYITDIGYYPNAHHHYRNRPEGSQQTILIYCVSGQGKVKIGAELHHLTADSFIIIPEGKSHAYFTEQENPWSIYWIHFMGAKTKKLHPYYNKPISITRGKDSRINSRLKLFEEIFHSLERGFGTDTLEFVNLSFHYLLASFIHVQHFRSIQTEAEKDPVTQSVNFMLENIHRSIRLNELASNVQLSVSHFSRLFISKTNQSPIDYFNQLKVQKACRLLDFSKLSVSEIAQELGYEDPFYFSRVFKKVMGLSPGKFRKKG